MSGHTSTPWQLLHDFTEEGRLTIIGNVDGEFGQDGATYHYEVVARCMDEFDEARPNAHDNAARIVRAVNCHDDLLDALNGLAEWVLHHSRYPDLCEPLKVARAAIAKATQP